VLTHVLQWCTITTQPANDGRRNQPTNMQTNRNAFYFSETHTNRDLDQWEREYEKAKEAYYAAKEELSDEEKGI
jgi:hypothetical protein